MGLAVLPSRLKSELATLADYIVNKKDIRSNPDIEKHAMWVEGFIEDYEITADNVDDILKAQVGKTFKTVLEHAGVYKCTDEGRAAFMRFVDSI